jgi:TPP-dependent pyruvate/acetoin dehydrogenase alpha subunit
MLALMRHMLRIRTFEMQVRKLYMAGQVPGLTHLCAGQEATAVGVCAQLRDSDYIASNHRGHGHCLAKGAEPGALLAEIMGRSAGICGGRGGSLHVFDPAHGNLGTNGIVGGGVPLAAGAAMAIKARGEDGLAVCFFGDGALNQGLVYECMNMASIWRLPVIFICENNGFGEYTASADVTAGTDPLARPAAFDVAAEVVDGMNVLEVAAAFARAARRARAGEGPSFLMCHTYRYEGHHVSDKQSYKSQAEIDEWRAKDPIERHGKYLVESGLASQGDIDALRSDVEREIADAVNFAKASSEPDVATLQEFV